MTSEEWILDYIKAEVLKNNFFDKELLVKLFGEFCLYCYLLKRDNELTENNIELLKIIDTNYGSLSHFNILLDSCVGKPISFVFPNEASSAMELSFLKSEFLNIKLNWIECFLRYIEIVSEEGINTKNAYLLTHIIFYSTNFGTITYWSSYEKLLAIITNFLEIFEDVFRIDHNWDLLREIYLSKIYLKSCNVETIKANITGEN